MTSPEFFSENLTGTSELVHCGSSRGLTRTNLIEMGETYTISATKRESTRAARHTERENGRVLGVVYGHGIDSTAVSFDASELLRLYRKAGQSALIEVDIEGKKVNAIIKNVELHPVRHELAHVDFLVVKAGEKTTVTVPIEFSGESVAVKMLGGTLMVEHNSLEIRCLPKNIPEKFEVDLAQLKTFSDQVTIAGLKIDAGKFEVMGLDEDTMICSVAVPKVEEEPVEMAETEEIEEGEIAVEPEVVGEKKGEEDSKK